MKDLFKRMRKVIWEVVFYIYRDLQSLTAFIQDYLYYRRASLIHSSPFRQDKMRTQMMLLGHSLEKGMSFECKKEGYGREKAIQLCNLLLSYLSKYPLTDEATLSINILDAYRKDEYSCKSKEVKEAIQTVLEKYKYVIQEGYAGTKFVEQPRKFEESVILDFFSSRSSVRYFSDEPLRKEDIDAAMKIANTTPTACNRQSSRVYCIMDPNKINKILDLQLGNQGWADKAKALIIITGSMSCFGGIYERQQVYIDGGLFAMNFVMGLHLNGLASCFKMFIRDKKMQNAIFKLCDIPENEVPIVLILAGHYKNKAVKDPVSHRFDRNVKFVL